MGAKGNGMNCGFGWKKPRRGVIRGMFQKNTGFRRSDHIFDVQSGTVYGCLMEGSRL